MNATERAATLQSITFFDEMLSSVDERTLQILEQRRKTATVRRRGWLVRRALLVADVFGLALAFVASEVLFPPAAANGALDFTSEYVLFVLTLPVWVVLAKIYRLYENDEERTDYSTVDDVVSVFHLVTVGAWMTFTSAWLLGVLHPDLPKLLTFWVTAIVGISLARAGARTFCRRRLTYLQNTLIVGAGEIGQLIARKFLHHRSYGINLVGFVDAEPRELDPDLAHVALLGPPDRLPGVVRLLDIERVVIAFSNDSHEQTLDIVRSLKDLDVQVDIVPRLFEVFGGNVGVHSVEGIPLVGLPPFNLARSSEFVKRGMDIVFAAAGLILLAPILAVIAWLVKRDSEGPVLFQQKRMGAGEHLFEILKFRTMVTDAEDQKKVVAHLNKHLGAGGDPRMFKIPDDPRVTRVGRVLRRYSLDELPQLWNVLKGEMSLVGPRPLIPDEDQYVDAWGRQRLNLKPGVTGPWQVLGGSDIPFAEMVKLDYLYVTGWSVFNDLKLVLKTAPALVRARDAY
jgi:exopolysaccharide biosynthesis polyprenyl glycosylphosphotransferase